MSKANATEAKEIALYFLGQIKDKSELTRGEIARTINMAKLMLIDYQKQDILDVIDHVLARKTDIYSLGFIKSAIPDALKALESERLKEKAKVILMEQEQLAKEQQGEVREGNESTERNREKARKFDVQSRLRKKFNFDLFEK